MEELASLLAAFYQEFQSEILDFYQRFYWYTLEILEERDLHFPIDEFNNKEKFSREIIERVIEITNLALMTIGVPKVKLNTVLKQFKENLLENSKNNINYYNNLDKHLREYIEQQLLEILLEYLFERDSSKMKKLNLFDLLPNNFINNLDNFKQEHEISALTNNIIKENISVLTNYINPSDFSIDLTRISAEKKNIYKSTSQLIQQPNSITQEIHEPSLYYFLKFNPIKEEVLKKFNINKDNLINSIIRNQDFYDLENLFYLISILQMLNINLPFKVDEIIHILKRFVSSKTFCSSKDGKPDPISNYFGLSILLELKILNNTDIINVSDIQVYFESELKDFIRENLHLNFYKILCLKLLEQSDAIREIKTHQINPILSLDIFSSKESINQILDIFEQLSIIQLLDNIINLNQFRYYAIKLKNIITQNDKIYLSITDSARMLLIFDLLDLKRIESEFCKELFNFITESTTFFDSDNSNEYFNWKIEKSALTIELRMLFWALIAGAQYAELS